MKKDFDSHLKIGIFEGVDPFDSLAELTEKTATHDQLSYVVSSTFSRRTNDRDYRTVVALDATNLSLTRSVAVAGELGEDTVIHEL